MREINVKQSYYFLKPKVLKVLQKGRGVINFDNFSNTCWIDSVVQYKYSMGQSTACTVLSTVLSIELAGQHSFSRGKDQESTSGWEYYLELFSQLTHLSQYQWRRRIIFMINKSTNYKQSKKKPFCLIATVIAKRWLQQWDWSKVQQRQS